RCFGAKNAPPRLVGPQPAPCAPPPKTNTPPAGSTTPAIVNYLVDTSRSLSHVVADLDAGGALTSYYLRADGELIGILRPNVTDAYVAKYPQADYIGSIRALTDDMGQ